MAVDSEGWLTWKQVMQDAFWLLFCAYVLSVLFLHLPLSVFRRGLHNHPSRCFLKKEKSRARLVLVMTNTKKKSVITSANTHFWIHEVILFFWCELVVSLLYPKLINNVLFRSCVCEAEIERDVSAGLAVKTSQGSLFAPREVEWKKKNPTGFCNQWRPPII